MYHFIQVNCINRNYKFLFDNESFGIINNHSIYNINSQNKKFNTSIGF